MSLILSVNIVLTTHVQIHSPHISHVIRKVPLQVYCIVCFRYQGFSPNLTLSNPKKNIFQTVFISIVYLGLLYRVTKEIFWVKIEALWTRIIGSAAWNLLKTNLKNTITTEFSYIRRLVLASNMVTHVNNICCYELPLLGKFRISIGHNITVKK